MSENKKQNIDLFGNPIIDNPLLRDKFIEPPFSILDTKQGNWQRRKKEWIRIGMKSEVGRSVNSIVSGTDEYRSIKNKVGYNNKEKYTSIFCPALCEVLYYWFCCLLFLYVFMFLFEYK